MRHPKQTKHPKQDRRDESQQESAPRVSPVSHAPPIHPAMGHEDNRTLAPHIQRARQAELRRLSHAHRTPHGRERGR